MAERRMTEVDHDELLRELLAGHDAWLLNDTDRCGHVEMTADVIARAGWLVVRPIPKPAGRAHARGRARIQET